MQIVCSYKDILQEELLLGDEVVIGRQEGDIAVDVDLRFDRLASHRHARIWVTDGACWLEDLGSKNGTSVNGVAMSPGRRGWLTRWIKLKSARQPFR